MSELRSREKFATQVDSELLADLRALAKSEGRQLQTLIEEAISKLIAERKAPSSSLSVKDALKMSIDQFAPLYKKLAE